MSLGSEYKLNRFDDPNYKETGLLVTNAEPYVENTPIKQPVTGSRRLGLLQSGSKLPGISFNALVQRLVDYITTYAFVTAEGTLPAHELRYTDGVDLKKFTDILVDSCELYTRVDGPLEARAKALAKTIDDFTSPSWAARTEEPMIYKNLTTVKIGSATITNWEEIVCRVRHNVIQKALGNTQTPSIVKGRQIEYSGSYQLSRAAASKLGDIYTGYVQDAVMIWTDNQSTPVVVTLTFPDAEWKASRIRIPGVDIEWELLEWEAKKLVIT